MSNVVIDLYETTFLRHPRKLFSHNVLIVIDRHRHPNNESAL